MDPIRNRAPRWLTVACLSAIAVFAVLVGRDHGPRDRGNPPNLGAIAPPASPEAPPALATTAVETPLPAPPAAKNVRGTVARATPPAGTTGAGRVIAIDPETGQPGAPSPEQMRALKTPGSTIESLTAEGLVETRLPNGTVILHLDERFHDYVIARVGRDGRVTYGCVFDHGGPERALRDTAAAPALEVE